VAEKSVAFETVGNHWYWRAKNSLDCQTGTLVEMPEDGKLVRVEIKVAGLDYSDPVYGYQNEPGYVVPAIWDASTGAVLSKGSARLLPASPGGTQPWESFDISDVSLKAGRDIIVGFWRHSNSSGYSTQWDYCTTVEADAFTTYGHHLYGSSSGPLSFVKSASYSGRSLNFRLFYESGGRVKVWNGSTWAVKTPKVWNGSAWVNTLAKVWDGLAWQESSE
jgi:hypothetical protein